MHYNIIIFRNGRKICGEAEKEENSLLSENNLNKAKTSFNRC